MLFIVKKSCSFHNCFFVLFAFSCEVDQVHFLHFTEIISFIIFNHAGKFGCFDCRVSFAVADWDNFIGSFLTKLSCWKFWFFYWHIFAVKRLLEKYVQNVSFWHSSPLLLFRVLLCYFLFVVCLAISSTGEIAWEG